MATNAGNESEESEEFETLTPINSWDVPYGRPTSKQEITILIPSLKLVEVISDHDVITFDGSYYKVIAIYDEYMIVKALYSDLFYKLTYSTTPKHTKIERKSASYPPVLGLMTPIIPITSSTSAKVAEDILKAEANATAAAATAAAKVAAKEAAAARLAFRPPPPPSIVIDGVKFVQSHVYGIWQPVDDVPKKQQEMLVMNDVLYRRQNMLAINDYIIKPDLVITMTSGRRFIVRHIITDENLDEPAFILVVVDINNIPHESYIYFGSVENPLLNSLPEDAFIWHFRVDHFKYSMEDKRILGMYEWFAMYQTYRNADGGAGGGGAAGSAGRNFSGGKRNSRKTVKKSKCTKRTKRSRRN